MPKESLYIVWMHAFGVTKRRNAGSVQKFLYDTEFVLRQIYTLKEQSKRRLYAIFTAKLRFEVAKLKLELKDSPQRQLCLTNSPTTERNSPFWQGDFFV